jgi:hypothetical protein
MKFTETVRICPGCKTKLGQGVCHFTYTTWRCPGCGGTIDSRVVMPEIQPRSN